MEPPAVDEQPAWSVVVDRLDVEHERADETFLTIGWLARDQRDAGQRASGGSSSHARVWHLRRGGPGNEPARRSQLALPLRRHPVDCGCAPHA